MEYIYYPSCSFNRLDMQSAKKLREYATSHNMNIAPCCKFDQREASEDKKAIYFCQECRRTQESKGFSSLSYWEVLDNDKEMLLPDYSGMYVTLLDCWRDRDHLEIHQAVRSLLDKMHVQYEELDMHGDKADFCGTLHYETAQYRNELDSFDHLSHLSKEWQVKLMQEKVTSCPTELIVCCCCRCYNGLLIGGGHPIHLMTLLMNGYIGREQELEAHALDLLSKPDPRYNMKMPS